MMKATALVSQILVHCVLAAAAFCGENASPLPGTQPLTLTGDIASELVTGVDRFLLTETENSIAQRATHWKRNFTSAEAYNASVQPNRQRLAHLIGARDARKEFRDIEMAATSSHPALISRHDHYEIFAVRWPAFGDVCGEGLLLVPTGRKPLGNIVVIPDADQLPEQIAGLVEGLPPGQQSARRLAESGCRVLVPLLINRTVTNRRALLTNREWLYRPAFVLGRHLIGYEVQKVLAAVDWFAKSRDGANSKIGVCGWGEGGLIALYASALDTRIDGAYVSGYFDDRNSLWQEPVDRNVFGLLEQFGDAELASLVAPRHLIIEAAKGPELTLATKGGAPGRLATPRLDKVRSEFARAQALVKDLTPAAQMTLVASGDGSGPPGTDEALQGFLGALAPGATLRTGTTPPQRLFKSFDPEIRHQRQMHEIERHTESLLHESAYVRKEFMKRLDTSSLEKFQKSAETYRAIFKRDVIGWFDKPYLPLNPRTRKLYDTAAFTGHEVVLDVFPDVIAYGIVLLPKNLKPDEKRPVVVCQHGLEGRPQETITGDHRAYHDFAAKLAERGFIVFAPQNLYLFGDRFRTLQRKSNPLNKTLFSIIAPQHQQIINWLKTLPNVDGERIAFYGLSYGGKSAMRLPALLTDYCLSICSADFNDWVWKNASTRSPYSYVWTPEYEIYEFDLGSTFNYAEMAALIAPRPFMVERGHFDGVAPDEAVAHEFAKIRHLYQAKLNLMGRSEIEWFVGPHTINGKGTFDFLHRHLKWAKP